MLHSNWGTAIGDGMRWDPSMMTILEDKNEKNKPITFHYEQCHLFSFVFAFRIWETIEKSEKERKT